MSDHCIVVGKAESNTVDFADSIVKLIDLARTNPRVAVVAGIGFGLLSATLLIATWYYSLHA